MLDITYNYVIKFAGYLRQVGDFLRVLWFPPPIKHAGPNITEILLKVALNTITLTPTLAIVVLRFMFSDYTLLVSSNFSPYILSL